MGSKSDLPIMQEAAEALQSLGVPYEISIVSAHRTPERMFEYATTAESRGIKVIIAGAGGAAHLPGMTASLTPLPVIGVPVATVALNGARNAGILAAQIMGCHDASILQKIKLFKEDLKSKVMDSVADLNKK